MCEFILRHVAIVTQRANILSNDIPQIHKARAHGPDRQLNRL